MSAGFMPGPWVISGDEIEDAHGNYICHFGGGDIADARLIAAAPALFEALKWFIDDIDSTHTVMVDFDANVERARKALSQALPEQSL